MTLAEFEDSLSFDEPPKHLTVELKALWYDQKGDWDIAHKQVEHLSSSSASLVHAYLHRKEGDVWNANYWYSRASEIRPNVALQEEWGQLVSRFLKGIKS